MRRFTMVVTMLALAAPLLAQQRMGANDPTKQVKGTGVLPSGWMMRFDPVRGRGGAPPPPAPTVDQINFVTMGSGYHFTTGPAAIYYNPKDMASGEYTVTATFSQRKSVQHEAYGIFIGGSNLQDSTQSYLYFVIKPGASNYGQPGAVNGEILISRRSSDGRPSAIR